MKRVLWVGKIVLIAITCYSCGGFKSKDERPYDSLFLGIYLGMGQKEFYDYCWEMNRQKKFTHGPTNQSVEYRFEDGVKDPVVMRFYPSFHAEKVYEMPVTFTYEAWSPWNKDLGADSLLVEVLSLFKDWYGDEFKSMEHKTMGTIYYRMDGKRRINLFKRDDQFVQAVFTDLKVEKQIKDEKQKVSETESTENESQ
jgi:hypothetical protein